jgi:hypothetical protein
MGISERYCLENPAWAAKRIDELEAQVVARFFVPVKESAFHARLATPEDIERALAFVDALDYSYGYTKWVDTMKTLALALRGGQS